MSKIRVLPLLTLLVCAAPLPAQVVLPESGYLAGPFDPQACQLGDEFFNFPAGLGTRPRPGESPLSGWLELRFEPVPDDPDRARFALRYDGAGPADTWSFENGQAWRLADNRAFSNPVPGFPNEGILNLRSGEIESITVNPVYQNSVIAQVTRNNRIPFAFTPTYPFDLESANALVASLPPELVPLLVPPQLLALEPGFLFSEAFFTYSGDGRITGFDFFGWTVVPAPLMAFLNPTLAQLGASPFPPFAFGLNGEFQFAHPNHCLPDTFCPTPESSPDGMTLDGIAFFRPYFLLGSKELAPAAPPAPAPACAPQARKGDLVLAHGGKLYQIGGKTAEEVTDRVDVYDLATGAWSPGPPLLFATRDAQGGVIGSHVYVYGGRAPDGGIRRRLQILDTLTGTWTEGPKGPLPVANGAAAVAGESLYVLGGRTRAAADGVRYSKAVLIYHATFPPGWDRMDPPPELAPSFTEGASAVTVGGEIWMLGGKKLDPASGARSVTDEVSVFSTVSREFRRGPSLAWGVYEAAAGRVGNRVYLAGGRQSVNGPATGDVQVLVIGQDEWRRTRPMLLPVARAGSAAVNEDLFIAGGIKRDGDPTRAFQTLNVGRGWSVCGSQPIFNSDDVLNSAALTVGPRPLSPGSLGVVTGYNFPDDVEITVNGQAADLVAGPQWVMAVTSQFSVNAVPQRLYFRVPEGAGNGAGSFVLRAKDSDLGLAVAVPIAAVSPGIYLETQGETRDPLYLDTASALACNQDGTLNYGANPAAPGETVTLRMTGLGADPSPASVSVTIDGIPAAVDAVTPGSPNGLWEVAVAVPVVGRSANRLPVHAEVAGVASNVAALAVLRTEEAGTLTRGRIPLPCHSPFD